MTYPGRVGDRIPTDTTETRRSVVDTARRMSRLGLVASTWGNVSARVPATGLAMITPSGVEYEALDEGMLCLVDVSTGAVVEGLLRPSSELPMHLGIYRARQDVGGIVHTHSVYATAHSVLRMAVPAVVEDLAQAVGGPVECAEHARAGTAALAEAVVRGLGDRGAVLMANHGLVGVGRTVDEALRVCLVVEHGARICAVARALGEPVSLPLDEVRALHRDFLVSYGQHGEGCTCRDVPTPGAKPS
jgi:L-ribulose-5-phosphate 4-epimerase